MSTESLVKARATRQRNAEAKHKAEVRRAVKWLRAMREESAARVLYVTEDEPRARERARKNWLHVRSEWAKLGRPPGDAALRDARKLERTDQ